MSICPFTASFPFLFPFPDSYLQSVRKTHQPLSPLEGSHLLISKLITAPPPSPGEPTPSRRRWVPRHDYSRPEINQVVAPSFLLCAVPFLFFPVPPDPSSHRPKGHLSLIKAMEFLETRVFTLFFLSLIQVVTNV